MHLLLNNRFGKGELTSTQKEGIIMCIPKEDKSTRKGQGGGEKKKRKKRRRRRREEKKMNSI